jgi:hypothetical protein
MAPLTKSFKVVVQPVRGLLTMSDEEVMVRGRGEELGAERERKHLFARSCLEEAANFVAKEVTKRFIPQHQINLIGDSFVTIFITHCFDDWYPFPISPVVRIWPFQG